MKRITVYLDDDTREDLFDLAAHRNISVSDLIRCAIIELCEDDLDAIAGEKGMRDLLSDPDSGMSIDEMRRQRALARGLTTGEQT